MFHVSRVTQSVIAGATLLVAGASFAGVTTTSVLMQNTWPGAPSIITYTNPNQPAVSSSRVPEVTTNTRLVSQTFQATSNMTLGHVAITTVGGGGDSYSIHLYDLSGGANLPGNYKPSTDGPNPGTDLIGGPVFAYNGTPVDNILVFNLDASSQAPLIAGHLYAFEIWPSGPLSGSSDFQWIRGGGAISTYAPGRGYETTTGNGNTTPTYASTNFRTPLAGSDRDLTLAVYAPGTVPEPATLSVLGMAGAALLCRRGRRA